MKKVVVHYPFIAKYRLPIFTLLNNSENYSFEFWADEFSSDKYLETTNSGLNLIKMKMFEFNLPFIKNKLELQPSAIKSILFQKFDAYIVLANPNSLTTWACVLISKIRRIPVLMWSHGYLKDERGIKNLLRKNFYRMANKHLLYGNRAKSLMIKKGFSEASLYVIYNSLDYEVQKKYRESLDINKRNSTRESYKIPKNATVLIAIGRLMKKLKIEQCMQAIAATDNQAIYLIVVGDGPEKDSLMALAKELNISEKVIFYGSCHEENELSILFNASDYSVVMGKVGLSAMHSLAYGIPMITNDNLNEHFPEIEAIIDNQTGFFFRENDLDDFKKKIKPSRYRGEFYNNCIKMLEDHYTPIKQKEYIENVLSIELRS